MRFHMARSLITTALVLATLSACGTPPAATPPAATIEPKKVPAADVSGKLQVLQRQLQEKDKLIEERDKRIEERDKRIAELQSQLDALKLIDQDRENQRKPLRPPTTLPPSQ